MSNKTSFEKYVEDKFYDLIFDGIKSYWLRNRKDFELAPDWMTKVFECDLDDIAISHVNVEDKEGMRIDFYPIVQATFSITGKGRGDVDTEYKNVLFRLHCTGDLSKELKDTRIVEVEDFNGTKKYKDAMTSGLVPYIKNELLDERATRILEEYYPEALKTPMRVSTAELARRMGLTVHTCTITEDGSVFGQIYFYDTVGTVFNKEKNKMQQVKISANTILVDKNALFLQSTNSARLTAAHECVHYALHKKAFEFKKLSCPQITQIQCQTSGDAVGFSDEKETSWMEYHANEIAPRILMPCTTFKIKAEEVIRDCFNRNKTTELIDVIEEVIDTLAGFYKVPRAVAKSRMVDIGYEEAFGAFTYIDGRYIKPYKTSKGFKFDRKKTFSIGYQDVIVAIASNYELYGKVSNGEYVYVDSHVVLKIPKYVEKDKSGNLALTKYARHHMDESCLLFDISYKDTFKINEKYYSYCVLNRDKNSPYQYSLTFTNGYENSSKEKQKEALLADLKEQRELATSLPRDFTGAINELKKRKKTTNAKLAEFMMCDEKTVERIINCKTGTTIQNIVLLCLALDLPPTVSMEIVNMSSEKFLNTDEHFKLRMFLLGGYGKSAEQIHAEAEILDIKF